MNKLSTCIILAASATSLLQADVLGEWTFNGNASPTDTLEQRLASSNLLAGVDSLSGLSFNDSFVQPATAGGQVGTDLDQFDFIGNTLPGGTNQLVIRIDRANFNNGDSVPSPRPTASDYSTFGPASSVGTTAGGGMGDAPFSFTITAGAQDVTVESLTMLWHRNGAIDFGFQEAGATGGTTVTASSSNTIATALLSAPTIVSAGLSQTFTVSLDSTALNSRSLINGFQLNGTVAVPEPSTYALVASVFALGAVVLRRRRQS